MGLEDGCKFVLKPGMRCQVSDQAQTNRSSASVHARWFIVDEQLDTAK